MDWDRLARYLTGRCSPEEIKEFEAWIAADASRAEFVALMRSAWDASGSLPPRLDVDAAWIRTRERLGLRRPGAVTVADRRPRERHGLRFPVPRRRVPAGWRAARRIAAAVAGIALAAALWEVALRPNRSDDLFAGARAYTTQPGERAEVRLPDGTRLRLSVASTLWVPEDYGDGSREVALEGEAYFEVTHERERPFRVHTAHGIATDLGTVFGVRAYAGDTGVRLVVREGAVSLRPAAMPPARPAPASEPARSRRGSGGAGPDSVLLGPGDLGRVDADGRLAVERGVAVDDYLAWTDGRLVFADAPLADAIAQLNRWYDLDIRLADAALGRLRITAVFTNEPMSDILRFLTAPLGLEFERQGRVITLRAR